MTVETTQGWITGMDPDVEWAWSPPRQVYRTRREAVRALRQAAAEAGGMLRPDVYGNRAHPWVAQVVARYPDADPAYLPDWEVPGCTCYGRQECAACLTARRYLCRCHRRRHCCK